LRDITGLIPQHCTVRIPIQRVNGSAKLNLSELRSPRQAVDTLPLHTFRSAYEE